MLWTIFTHFAAAAIGAAFGLTAAALACAAGKDSREPKQ